MNNIYKFTPAQFKRTDIEPGNVGSVVQHPRNDYAEKLELLRKAQTLPGLPLIVLDIFSQLADHCDYSEYLNRYKMLEEFSSLNKSDKDYLEDVANLVGYDVVNAY